MSTHQCRPEWWQEPSILPEEAWAGGMMGLLAGGADGWYPKSMSQDYCPARPLGPSGAQTPPLASILSILISGSALPSCVNSLQTRNSRGAILRVKAGVGMGNDPAHRDSNVSPTSLSPPALCGHKTEMGMKLGVQLSPDLEWEPPGTALSFPAGHRPGLSKCGPRDLTGSAPRG